VIEIAIPDTIKIGGFNYTILHNKDKDIELYDNVVFGTHSAMLRRIELKTDSPPQQKSLTFIHECLHAIDDIYLCQQIKSDILIDGLANGLLQLFEQLGVRFVK